LKSYRYKTSLAVLAAAPGALLAAAGCQQPPGAVAPTAPPAGCIAQATAVYDSVALVRRVDGALLASPDGLAWAAPSGLTGVARPADIAASGSSAYGNAIGCALAEGGAWCFPLAGPLIDSTDLGAGLGAGVTTTSAVAVVTATGAAAARLGDVRQLAASMNGGVATFCAVTGDGGEWCWGGNPSGLLGHGDAPPASGFARPVMADARTPISGVAELRLGYDSACARKRDGSVWCWGGDALGQLGDGGASAAAAPYPARVALPGAAVRLAANPGHTHCALLADARIVCWGWNEYAQAGADAAMVVGPTVVRTAADGPPLLDAVDLAPDHGMQAMCANAGAAGLLCWGNTYQPTLGTRAVSPYPAAVADAGPVRAAAGVALSSFGGRDGALVYVDARGRVVFGAGGPGYPTQPPCP
jgi:hypothetical protein